MSILDEFYKFEEKGDPCWKASVESQIKYGKIDFIYYNAHMFEKQELAEVEKYFIENDGGTLFDVFNRTRWKIRKQMESKADGLFTATEFYYIDWLSKPFVIAEQNEEMLKSHLEAIENKIKELDRINDGEMARKEVYASWHLPTSITCQPDKDIEENNKEIIALKAAYENMKGLILR